MTWQPQKRLNSIKKKMRITAEPPNALIIVARMPVAGGERGGAKTAATAASVCSWEAKRRVFPRFLHGVRLSGAHTLGDQLGLVA
jgi:hypothetical protein